jgi:hypothetical protein
MVEHRHFLENPLAKKEMGDDIFFVVPKNGGSPIPRGGRITGRPVDLKRDRPLPEGVAVAGAGMGTSP